jgi:hypothetical protein
MRGTTPRREPDHNDQTHPVVSSPQYTKLCDQARRQGNARQGLEAQDQSRLTNFIVIVFSSKQKSEKECSSFSNS